MTKETNKCPNCGHHFKDGEDYCPNCDLFIPVNDQTDQENNFDPNETKQFKTFKEIEKEATENYPESRFKHRNIQPEPKSDKQELATEVLETADEESHPLTETEPKKTTEVDESLHTTSTEEESVVEEAIPSDHEEVIPETPPTTTSVSEDLTPLENISRGDVNNTNNRKKMIIGLSAVAVLAVGGYYVYSNEQEKATEKNRVALVQSTQKELDSLFSSNDKVFLKENITETDFNKAKEELEKLKTKSGYDELKELFDEAEDKFNKQQSMNSMFKSPIIKGNELNKESFVKDDSAITLTKISEEKDGFDILFNKAYEEAEAQKAALSSVNNKMNELIKNKKVVTTATRSQYDEATKLVNSLQDEDAKKTYQAQLKQVETFLVETETKKQETAQQVEEQQLIQENQSNNNTEIISPSGPSSDYRWGNRQDEYIDYNDSAWAWNPGIQDKVMTEVISRGYVVDGGYSLVPKYIENGEGFYDLYATTNSKIFPNSKPEEFPLYVVTINVKTGWFKGNGPN